MAFDLNPFFYIEKYGDWSSSPNRPISPFACITVYSLCLQDQLIHYLYDTILIEILFSFLKMENKGLNVLINLGPASVFAFRLDFATCASGAPGHLVICKCSSSSLGDEK
jgi:hypothetical protein